jgi:hypothetical protein
MSFYYFFPQLLLTILDKVINITDLRACRLVCAKWFCIIEQRVQLKLQETAFNEINDSIYTLYRQPKKLLLYCITIDNVSEEFAEILRNCEEVTIDYHCHFVNVQSLKTILLSCKNLKVFKIRNSLFEEEIIEGIIADAQHQKTYENAEIGLLSLTCTDNANTWELIKTFEALGIQLNSLGLEITFSNFSMELFKYVKENYETKLKSLTIFTDGDDFLRYIGEWNKLQLQLLYCHGATKYGIFDRLIERQTALKHLDSVKILNIERFPMSLRHISIEIKQENAQTTVDKLSELKHLHHLNIKVHCERRCKLNFSVLRHMIQLQVLRLEAVYLEKGYGIELDLQDLCTPLQKMKNFTIMHVQIGYETMQKIIEIMPNLDNLELSDLPKMVSVLNFTLQKENIEFCTLKCTLRIPAW